MVSVAYNLRTLTDTEALDNAKFIIDYFYSNIHIYLERACTSVAGGGEEES